MRLGIFSPIKSHLLFLLWELSVAFGLFSWSLAFFLLIYRSLLFIKDTVANAFSQLVISLSLCLFFSHADIFYLYVVRLTIPFLSFKVSRF